MNKIVLKVIAVALMACGSIGLCSQTLKHYTVRKNGSSELMDLRVDSVDFRDDLTRVYGKLMGRPHTSSRIDRLYITISGKQFESMDIDGVDMKRWFQWEDDGLIPVEIDFMPMKHTGDFEIVVNGPRGEDRWIVTNAKRHEK